jgi:hypothetical protein
MGQRSDEALAVSTKPGIEIVPGAKARALISYLMSLKHDDPVPASMDFSPADKKGDSEG